MIFAMTIATGLLTASFANAQDAATSTHKKHKQASSKTEGASKSAVTEPSKKTGTSTKTGNVKLIKSKQSKVAAPPATTSKKPAMQSTANDGGKK